MSEQVRSPRMWSLFGLFALISGFYFAVELMMQTAILALSFLFEQSVVRADSVNGEVLRKNGKRTDVLLLTAPVRTRSIVLAFLSGVCSWSAWSAHPCASAPDSLLGGTIDKITWAAYLAFLLTGLFIWRSGNLSRPMIPNCCRLDRNRHLCC